MGSFSSTGRILIALLFWCATANAAITVTARGTVTNNASSSSFACGPASTIAAGTMGILFLATDNAGSAGSSTVWTQTSVNDSVGNTWTRRQAATYDPGAASAGTDIAIYTASIVTQLTAINNVTITLSTATTPKVAVFWEVSSAAGTIEAYINSGVKCSGCTSGQTGTAVQLTTGTITNTEAVACFVGAEGSSAITADSDTTNGSWNTQQSTSAGSGTTGQHIGSQVKIVTATATQSYDVTLGTSEDWNAGWVEIAEVTPSSTGFMNFFKP